MGSSSTFFLPTLSLFPGHIPAHEAKCFSVGKTVMFKPISAIKSSTVFVLKPGMPLNASVALSYSDKLSSILKLRSVIRDSVDSISCFIVCNKNI